MKQRKGNHGAKVGRRLFPWLAWGNLNNSDKCGLSTVNTNNDLSNTNWNIAAGAPAFISIILGNYVSIMIRDCNMHHPQGCLGESLKLSESRTALKKADVNERFIVRLVEKPNVSYSKAV